MVMRNNFHQIYPNQRWPEPRFSFTKTLADGPRSYNLNNDLVNIYIKMKYLFCQFIECCFYTALCCNYQFPKKHFWHFYFPSITLCNLSYQLLNTFDTLFKRVYFVHPIFIPSFLSHCYNFISFKETMTVIDQGLFFN